MLYPDDEKWSGQAAAMTTGYTAPFHKEIVMLLDENLRNWNHPCV